MKARSFARLLGLALALAVLAADGSVIAHAGITPAIDAAPPPLASVAPPTVVEHVAPPAPRRYDPVADARAFVALINKSRTAHGLAPLAMRRDLTSIALRWSARMAARKKISHNHHFRDEIDGWWLLGENVGWSNGSVTYLHRAFLASPKHRRNILDPRFTSIGVGETVSSDGRIFVTEDFGRFSRI